VVYDDDDEGGVAFELNEVGIIQKVIADVESISSMLV